MPTIKFEFKDSFEGVEEFLKIIQQIQKNHQKSQIEVFLNHLSWPQQVSYPQPAIAALSTLRFAIDEVHLYLNDLIKIDVIFKKVNPQ